MAEEKRLGDTIGKSDSGSSAKAKAANQQANKQQETLDASEWPRNANGQPMAKITMTAAELIPTGQYANVSVGPAQITTFVDLDRYVDEEEGYFSEQEKAVMIKGLNELAEVVEADVVAVQRNLVLDAMKDE